MCNIIVKNGKLDNIVLLTVPYVGVVVSRDLIELQKKVVAIPSRLKSSSSSTQPICQQCCRDIDINYTSELCEQWRNQVEEYLSSSAEEFVNQSKQQSIDQQTTDQQFSSQKSSSSTDPLEGLSQFSRLSHD